ncbi:MAG: IS66 family transposase [Candidatus Competibacteraceae bacterium]|nr:IS66 family transposase [Candidatus Competibacteraceae bacterium]
MPAQSDNSADEIQKLQAALANSEAKNARLTQQYEEIKKQLQEALDGNKTLQVLLQDLQSKLDILLIQTKKRNRKDFGKQTEQHNPRPAPATDESTSTTTTENQTAPANPQKPKVPAARNHKKHIHEQNNLPVRPVPHKVSASKAKCPTCLIDTKFVRNEVSYQLERICSTLEKLEHQQEVRSCPKCKTYIVTAEKACPPLPGANCGPRLLATVIVSKLADGLPNYRQSKIYKRVKITIPRSTQSDWSMAASLLLQPLYDLLKTETLKSEVIKTDDTEIKIQDRNHPNKIRKGKITPYVGDSKHPLTFFDFSPDKSFARNILILKDYKGFVQCDAASGFDALFRDGTKVEVGCNSHNRRRYYDAKPLAVADCDEILDIFGALYKIEEDIKGKTQEEILQARQAKAKPLFERFNIKISTLKGTLNPTHPLMSAIDYSLNHWAALTRYLDDPRLSICNNETERTIKDFVLCRKNFLFAGSDAGGTAVAVHLSFIASCKRNNVDPVEYLTDVFSRINTLKTSELEQLLPDRWKPACDIS